MRQKQRVFSLFLLSPSSRRAWIEIEATVPVVMHLDVALLTEGVDRNPQVAAVPTTAAVSPSSRRAWIEMISEDIWRPT